MKAEHEKYSDISENEENQETTTQSKWKINWSKDELKSFFFHPIALAVYSVIATFFWVSFFENQLVQYVPTWVYIASLFVSTFILFTFLSKAFAEDDQRRAVKWTPIVLILILQFLPLIDMAKFDKSGETLQWINIENGTNYHRPVNEIHEDNKGEYFFDPINGDTCRKATDHWKQVEKRKNPVSKSVHITTYDTLINEVYSSHDADKEGVLYTNVYGYDLNKLNNPEIVITNLRTGGKNSVVIGHVNTCVDIYASYRQPEARYKYKDQVTEKLNLSIPLTFKGKSEIKVQVLVLETQRVRQSLAQK